MSDEEVVEDVFPVEYTGIRKAMEKLYGLEGEQAMMEKSEDWRPYRSPVSLYLWNARD